MGVVKGLTRKVIVTDNGKNLMKLYSNDIAAMTLDFLRTILSMISLKPQIEFLDVNRRMKNEMAARRKIKSIATSKIIKYSLEKRFIVENFVRGNIVKNSEISYRIGKFIGRLHSCDMALIDNRPSNYIINNGKITRIDLEMFRENASEFDKMCDLLSFAESFDDDKIKSAFFSGHDKLCKCRYNSFIGFLSRLFLRLIDYIE